MINSPINPPIPDKRLQKIMEIITVSKSFEAMSVIKPTTIPTDEDISIESL